MPNAITVIRNAHTIVAHNAARGGHAYLNDADVAFDASGFVQVGGRYEGPFAEEISGRDRMVMPGFVNVHCHSGEEPISKSLFEDAGTAALWGQAMYEYPFNMLEEMRTALICARIAGGSVFDVNTADILDMATLAGAQALGRNDIGRIAKGAKADFSLVDLKHPGMQPHHDPLRNLLHCAAERAVSAVYVDGTCVVEGGRPTRVDYDGAVGELQAVQDFAVRRLQANDPRGRSASELAPLSLPVMS